MDIEEKALEYTQRYVRYGFYESDEIERIVGEEVFSDAIPRKRLRKMIKTEVDRQRTEERSWPAVTDCDRLDRAFDALEAEGILALHNAGLTPSEGMDELNERYHAAGGATSGIIGYCFYHQQDIEYALEHGELSLAFGDINGYGRRGVEIGKRVRFALEAAGLPVDWSGSIEDKLDIRNFLRQRRRKNA